MYSPKKEHVWWRQPREQKTTATIEKTPGPLRITSRQVKDLGQAVDLCIKVLEGGKPTTEEMEKAADLILAWQKASLILECYTRWEKNP